MHKKKVRFEINLTAAKRAKLEIRSQLLRLAKKVIKPPPPVIVKLTKRDAMAICNDIKGVLDSRAKSIRCASC